MQAHSWQLAPELQEYAAHKQENYQPGKDKIPTCQKRRLLAIDCKNTRVSKAD